MRFIMGLIFGIMLTVGAAYVTDMLHSAPGPDQTASRAMVNWTVVGDNMRGLSTSVQDGWGLAGGRRPEAAKADRRLTTKRYRNDCGSTSKPTLMPPRGGGAPAASARRKP